MANIYSCIYLFLVVSVWIVSANHYFSAAPVEFRDDYHFSDEARGWLKIHRVPATWVEAKLKCYYEGAVLMSPINDKLYAVMKSLVLSNSHPSFIGVQSLTDTGDYLSVEGVNLSKMPIQWAEGEPDNQKDEERCLAILTDGTVADVACGKPRTYMCYKEWTGNETINECGTFDKGYELDPVSKSCYKYHSDCVEWHRAHMVCAAEGGHLVVLNSAYETQLMIKWYWNRPMNCNVKKYPHGRLAYHAGFHNIDLERAYWFTLDGKRIEDSGYAVWSPDEPNNDNEKCGGVWWANGGLIDVFCSQENLPFICEITNPKTQINAY